MKINMPTSAFKDVINAVQSVEQTDMWMVLGEDKWVVKAKDAANVSMVGAQVTEEVMNSYEKGETDAIGLDVSMIDNFISSGDGNILLDYDEEKNKLSIREGRARLECGTLIRGAVNGVADEFPKVQYPVQVHGDLSFLEDFMNRASAVFNTQGMVMEAREQNFYLYMKRDEKSMSHMEEWDYFDEYNLDWSLDNARDGVAGCGVAIGFLQELYKPSKKASLQFGEDSVIKFFYDVEDGPDITYFVAPRVPSDDNSINTVPETAVAPADRT